MTRSRYGQVPAEQARPDDHSTQPSDEPRAAARSAGRLRIGTRRSELARTQSEYVAALLRDALDVETELVVVTTEGDRTQKAGTPLTEANSTGVFVSALREALLADEVDIAVHSLKDLPTRPEPGIALAAIPEREDPRDVVVARDGLTLGELPAGSTVGTGSPRRATQVRALGLGLDVVGIRGNVGTRIDKVRSGECDAVVLARAGLARTGRLAEVTEVLDPLQMLPAPGQGALAVECRADDADLVADVAQIDHPATHIAVAAERATLATLEGGCSAPIGALGEIAEGEHGLELWLRAVVLSADGAVSLRRSATAPLPETDPVTAATDLGTRLAEGLLEEGAGRLDADSPRPAQPARSAEVQN